MNLTFNTNHYPGMAEHPATLRTSAVAIHDRPDGITIVADFGRQPGPDSPEGARAEHFYMNLDSNDARAIAASLLEAASEYDRLVAVHSTVTLTVEVPADRAEDFKADVTSIFDGRVL